MSVRQKGWLFQFFHGEPEERNSGPMCGDKVEIWDLYPGDITKEYRKIIAINKKKHSIVAGQDQRHEILDSRDIEGWNGFYWEYEKGRHDRAKALKNFTKGKDWTVCGGKK